jgi:hypothetical protein
VHPLLPALKRKRLKSPLQPTLEYRLNSQLFFSNQLCRCVL